MYFNGMFDLSAWDADAEYAVFDDWWDWSKWTCWKQFIGAQQEFTLTDKYVKKRRVTWGKPCILLSNHMPEFSDMTWFRDNCIVCHVQTPLFLNVFNIQ